MGDVSPSRARRALVGGCARALPSAGTSACPPRGGGGSKDHAGSGGRALKDRRHTTQPHPARRCAGCSEPLDAPARLSPSRAQHITLAQDISCNLWPASYTRGTEKAAGRPDSDSPAANHGGLAMHSSVRVFDRRTPPVEMMAHRRAWRVGPATFRVVGRDGQQRYAVRVLDGVPHCNCPAGRHGRPCYHAALVLRRLGREGALR